MDYEDLWEAGKIIGREINDKKMKLFFAYSNFSDMFSKDNVDVLPKHGPHNHAIELKKSKKPFFGFTYKFFDNWAGDVQRAFEWKIDKNFL